MTRLIRPVVWCAVLVLSAVAAGPAVRCDWFAPVAGSQVTDLLANPTTLPTPTTQSLPEMGTTTAPAAPGVVRLIATAVAPTTGPYRFLVCGDATAAVFVGTKNDVGSLREVASVPAATNPNSFTWFAAQRSDPIELVAGQKVLVEAIAKTDAKAGNLAVAWVLPDNQTEGPIPAARLEPFAGDVPVPVWTFRSVTVELSGPPAKLTAGFNRFVRGAKVTVDGQSFEMSYLLYVPKKFAPADCRPMLTYLHGMSNQGYDLKSAFHTGPIHNLSRRTDLDASCPMFCLFPQLPPGWRWDTPGAGRIVNQMVKALYARYPQIDSKRLYLTGNSMGGKGTWITAEDDPDQWAAVVPISAVDVRPDEAKSILSKVPYLHLACGSEDGGFTAGTHRMFESLKPILGDRITMTEFKGEGHGVWDHSYAEAAFYNDLLKYHR